MKTPINGPDILAQAKANMVYDHPFFASIVFGMPFIKDSSIPTAATNGLEVRYSPDWINTLTLPEAIFLLAHETMHVAFQHCLEIGDKNPQKWNVATDLVINDLLTKGSVGKMPKGGLLDASLVLQGGGTAEGVYRILPKDTESKNPVAVAKVLKVGLLTQVKTGQWDSH
jgi:hypothetical protein